VDPCPRVLERAPTGETGVRNGIESTRGHGGEDISRVGGVRTDCVRTARGCGRQCGPRKIRADPTRLTCATRPRSDSLGVCYCGINER
jgi:hypothetical protein